MLLGAWTSVCEAHRILDVGTGTGLVALMLAQRSGIDSFIVALEIDAMAAQQAEENASRSPWKDRIQVIRNDFKEFSSSEKFDVIVSNPPYFVDSLACPNSKRNVARHNNSLTYRDLMQGVAGLLSEKGEFTIIVPADVFVLVKDTALAYGLYAIRQLNVVTKPEQELLTELARHQYSEEYIALTKEYYLHM